MEGRRLVSTETQVVDVQSKLGGDTEAGKGDNASEQKAQVSEVHQNDCVEMTMMMTEQKGLESKRLRTVAGPAVSSYLHSTLRKVTRTKMTRELKTSTDLDTNDC